MRKKMGHIAKRRSKRVRKGTNVPTVIKEIKKLFSKALLSPNNGKSQLSRPYLQFGSSRDMKRHLPAISLFSGALGLDLGLEASGFQTKVAVECNKVAVDTIRRNRPDIAIIDKRIERVTSGEILEAAGLEVGEPVVVTAGPCCQSFSTAGQRGSLGDPRGVLFREFLRVVRDVRPRFFVMENVRGLLSSAIRHRPLKERGPGYPTLEADEELGSAFALILKELKETGYYVVFDLLNTADFGVPQIRERIVFIGSRDGEPIAMPKPTHGREPNLRSKPWVTLRQSIEGIKDPCPAYNGFPPSKKRYVELVPAGGNWRDLPTELQAEALGRAYVSWGGRCGFFRRLSWDKPSPALTTAPTGKATMLCHPTADRPLTVGEYAKIQQFPARWTFAGATRRQYIQIGNAVPIGLGKAIGRAIIKAMGKDASPHRLGTIACMNEDLIRRLTNRKVTVLNPIRMRNVKDPEETKKWLSKRIPLDFKITDHVICPGIDESG